MPSQILCKLRYLECWIVAKPIYDRANPTRSCILRLSRCTLHEDAQRHTEAIFASPQGTKPRQNSCVRTRAPAQPLGDGNVRNPCVPKPSRVELDLNLLEASRADDVAMDGAGPIEGRRGTGDGRLAEFRPTGISTHHEDRQQRPAMRVLWDAGITPVDDPSNHRSIKASQHPAVPKRSHPVPGLSGPCKTPSSPRSDDPSKLNLESVQYTSRGSY